MLDLVSLLVTQAPLVATAIAILVVYIERRIAYVEKRLSGLESRLGGLESRLDEITRSVNSLVDFNEALLSIQVGKGLLAGTEYKALQTLLAVSRPQPKTKYYTKEVYERLGQLLSKDPDELTWDDVFELEKIHDLLIMEWRESRREELARYAGKLRVAIAMAKGFLLKRGVLPPPNKPV